MLPINEHYLKLQASYLFSEIARRVAAYEASQPDLPVIKLGIGDVTEPLPPVCITALHKAVEEMGRRDHFHGYGPEQGYDFLREAIAEYEFRAQGIAVAADEIFVSDGAKCDTANIQDLFSQDAKIAIPDPVYPVYVDTQVMAGRTGICQDGRYTGLVYLDCTPENGYIPTFPPEPVDVIYLCFPNNPTGAVATREQLQVWVDYAREHNALILHDAAYRAFIRDPALPQSIYAVAGAEEVAIEFHSFSKNAGFTGTRCAFTVVPKAVHGCDTQGKPYALHGLWSRRHATKFNGVSYPVQRAAAAIYTEQGQQQVRALTDFYMANARQIREALQAQGYHCSGGDNAPYVWIHTGTDSWAFFARLLNEAGVVCTPGAGFGRCGEGHIRLSAFNSQENVTEALTRIRAVCGNRL